MFSFATRSGYKRVSVALKPPSVSMKRLVNGSAVYNGDPELLETEKRRNLDKRQHLTSTTYEELAPGWNEYLATPSEADIKADRLVQDGPPTTELTERTIRHLKKRHHGEQSTKSSREEALYERDEVEGPLKNSFAGTTDDSAYDEKFEDKQGTKQTKTAFVHRFKSAL